ncbi:MAG TPA: ACT domain-containing protein [bacterium]|nr:ACT domain-containing protein [bacterium]
MTAGTPQFFIIDRAIVSDTLIRVVEAKRLMREDSSLSVSDATRMAGVSRSAFYKYKDFIHHFNVDSLGRNLTFSFDVRNIAGQLSRALNAIAESGANILTINQTIPINDICSIVVTVETTSMNETAQQMIDRLRNTEGMFNIRVLARNS